MGLGTTINAHPNALVRARYASRVQNAYPIEESAFAAYKRLTGTNLDRHYIHQVVFKKDNIITGLAIFCDYTGQSVTLHLHMPNQLDRKAIKKILNYAFDDLGVDKIYAEIKSSNKTINKIAQRVGFRVVGCLFTYYGTDFNDDDKIILAANKQDVAKWIK